MAKDCAEPTLVVLAAGGGTRFGGPKQLEPVGPHGEAIMEYSIHDAIASGFSKIVLVIRREHAIIFHERILAKIAGRAQSEIVCQDLTAGRAQTFTVDRQKPWGTAHAVLAARETVGGPFAVLNADDFYEPSAIATMGAYLCSLRPSDSAEGAMVGYPLRNTLSAHGSVSRGVCTRSADGYLAAVVESHKIVREPSGAIHAVTEGRKQPFRGDEIVSMNLWGFCCHLFGLLEREFAAFMNRLPGQEEEFELPTVANRLIAANELRVQVLETQEQWCGLTYRADLANVRRRLSELIEAGVYPARLG